MEKPKIPGGYYIKARKIQDSEIAHSPPHFREIWDWLIKEANHKDRKINGKLIKRGQCLRTYQDILDGLSWKVGYRTERYTKWQCEEAMKFLRTRLMITTTRTTRGIIITILNYNEYQNPKNYEDHNDHHNEDHNSPQGHHTINKNDKNDKNVNNNKEIKNCPHQKIISLYHELLPEMPKVRIWNDNQQFWLNARWKEDPERQTLEWWKYFFQWIRKSDWLMGRTKQEFHCDLEWLIRKQNFAKIANGRYHRKNQNKYSGVEEWLKTKSAQLESRNEK